MRCLPGCWIDFRFLHQNEQLINTNLWRGMRYCAASKCLLLAKMKKVEVLWRKRLKKFFENHNLRYLSIIASSSYNVNKQNIMIIIHLTTNSILIENFKCQRHKDPFNHEVSSRYFMECVYKSDTSRCCLQHFTHKKNLFLWSNPRLISIFLPPAWCLIPTHLNYVW